MLFAQAIMIPPDVVCICSCAELNGALLQASIYGAYYIILEPFAGLTWTLFQGWPMWLTASLFRQALPNAWAWAFGVHILGWYMQIHIGHMLIEGRKPALLDSLFQVDSLLPQLIALHHVSDRCSLSKDRNLKESMMVMYPDNRCCCLQLAGSQFAAEPSQAQMRIVQCGGVYHVPAVEVSMHQHHLGHQVC